MSADRRILIGARIFDGAAMQDDCALIIEGGRVSAIMRHAERPRGGEQIDLSGGVIAPGFIDAQVNGGGGVLFNATPTVEGIAAIARAHLAYGATSLLPTVITDAPGVLAAALEAARQASGRVPGAIGIHVEGPYIDGRRKGVHPAGHIRAMKDEDVAQLIEAQCGVMMVTLAPAAASGAQIHALTRAGIIVSLGHADCSAEDALGAFASGASCVTHLYNAMSQLASREPGLVGATLASPQIICGFIADGQHVHAAAANAAFNAKGPQGIALISDAMPPAAGGPGEFQLMGRRVRRVGARLSAEDGTLAGAAITMLDAVRYVVRTLKRPLAEALQMATLTPARMLKIEDRLGRIRAGAAADLIHLRGDLSLAHIWKDGVRIEPAADAGMP